MESTNHTLIVNYCGLQTGGIEAYLAPLMKYALDRGYRVIWLTSKKDVATAHYSDVAENPLIEKVYTRDGVLGFFRYKKVRFLPDENVTMLTCQPMDFLMAESIRRRAKTASFYHFLVLAHFTGCAIYPERCFKSKLLYNWYFSFMRTQAAKLVQNDCIRAFSMKHLTAYEDNYGIQIPNKQDKLLNKFKKVESFDDTYLSRKAAGRTQSFRIVSCARYDFPHKGFLIGLIDTYVRLKNELPQLNLTIIGYGNGESQLKEKINKLPDYMQQGIRLTGRLPAELVRKEFMEASLNVGLAGGLLEGAACAVPSLVTRHNSYTCETYGFFYANTKELLREDPGYNIEAYIRKVIAMSDREYIAACTEDYEAIKQIWEKPNQDSDYIFKQTNLSSEPMAPLRKAWLYKLLYFPVLVKRFLFQFSAHGRAVRSTGYHAE